MTAETILALYEREGLRSTRPRRLIAERLAELAAQGDDFATDELWRDLQQQDPGLGRATVFRAVDVLAERGVLDRVSFADGTHRYRVCDPHIHHHHMTCIQCRRIVDVPACLSSDVLARIERETDFAIEGHAIELYGRCPSCRTEA